MSQLFTLTGRTSVLSTEFYNPIVLDPNFQYGLALIGFHSYNSIPNIEQGGNKFYYIDKSTNKEEVITIPTGSYEIADIENYINKQIQKREDKKSPPFSLKPNHNTIKCELYSHLYSVNFKPKDSIRKILGFSEKELEAGFEHTSDLPVDFVKVNTVHIDCNITSGAHYNNKPGHNIYEFSVNVDAGYSIDIQPTNLIYLPVNNKREINNITLTVLNEDGELVNFRGEKIIIRLELKKLWA